MLITALRRPASRRLALRPASRRLASSSAWPAPLRGVWPIMATPFHPDDSIDIDGFRRAVAFMACAVAEGVTVTGVLGESNRLTDAEREVLVRAALEATAPSGCRVCVGTSHPGTAATAALSRMAHDLGAHAVMVTPAQEAASVGDDARIELYRRVADACPGLPIVLQDHPASTGVHMPPSLIARITAEVAAVRCIKLESLPSPARIATLRALWAERPPAAECTILTGLGALYGGFDMEQGTDGFMTGFAFPEVLRAMHAAACAGDGARAHALYARYLPLIVFEQQPGVGVRKELYRLRGLVGSAHVRHPGTAAGPVLRRALAEQIARSLPGVDITEPLAGELFSDA